MTVFHVTGDALPQFKENEHPRDNAGKFSEGGSSPTEGSSAPSPGIRKILLIAGYKRVKGSALATFVNQQGDKVVLHPSTSPGGSSTWTSEKGGKTNKSGSGSALASLLGLTKEDLSKPSHEWSANPKKPGPPKPGLQPHTPANQAQKQHAAFQPQTQTKSSSEQTLKVGHSLSGALKSKFGGEITNLPVVNADGTTSFTMRSVGQWEVPPDEEDDGDYDWKQLTDSSAKKIKQEIETFEKEYGVKVSIATSEKEYIEFTVSYSVAPKPSLSVGTQISNALAAKGYSHSYTPAGKNGDVVVYKNANGAHVEFNNKTGDWVAQTPGHGTKEGNGAENLAQLMSGKPAVMAPGQMPPWKNSIKSLSENPVESYAKAEKTAKIDAHHSAYQKLKSMAPEATYEEKSAVSSYSGQSYAHMNNKIRTDPEAAKSDPKIQALDTYLRKGTIPEDVMVYRGVSGDYAAALKTVLKTGVVEVGGKFTERGFMSTSANPNKAKNFGSSLFMKINVKKGSKGVAIGDLSNHGTESEVLFPLNCKMLVKSFNPYTSEMEVDLLQE